MTYYENVGGVKDGDLIVHYVEPQIIALSRAEEDGFYMSRLPSLDGHDYGPGWMCRTEYFNLNAPIHRDRVLPHLAPLSRPHYPINENGNPRRGYLFPFDLLGLSLILSSVDDPLPAWLEIHRNRTTNSHGASLPEELESTDLPEGAQTQVTVNAYERNREAREKCIEHYGAVCIVCRLDFAAEYTDVAHGLIHVHHKMPLSKIREQYIVDPINDLCPVCPNCHAVMHLKNPPYTVEEVQALREASARRFGSANSPDKDSKG